MSKIRIRVAATVLAATSTAALAAGVLAASPAAHAANSPTFRDCALIGGLDPDFLQLSGVTPGASGLSVAPGTTAVTLLASESADPLDNAGHDTLKVTVTSPGATTRTVSGAGTGKVTLSVPLASSAVGAVNTIDFKATFDTGTHPCPGSFTPRNPAANPFTLTVAAGTAAPPVAPTLSQVRESHRSWREHGGRGSRAPVGTAFSFRLDRVARVEFSFAHAADRRAAGRLAVAGGVGANSVRFNGTFAGGGRLKPGRYTVTVSAVGAGGLRSQPSQLTFTIVR